MMILDRRILYITAGAALALFLGAACLLTLPPSRRRRRLEGGGHVGRAWIGARGVPYA
jgi:hypothetical protein